MLLVWGRKFAGHAAGVHGHYAATKFFHIYWLPIIPLGFVWVTGHDDDMIQGHPIRPCWRSVVSGYLRAYGLFFGGGNLVIGLALGNWLEALGGAGGLLVVIASYLWRHAPRSELRERELFEAAVGTYCDPELLTADMVRALRARLDAVWQQKWPLDSPQDLARRGVSEPAQLPGAYAMLRLAARDADRRKARELRELAAALVAREGARKVEFGDGPYRKSQFGAL